jgi:hypothetical protein
VQSRMLLLYCGVKTVRANPLRKWHERVAKGGSFKAAVLVLARKLTEIIFNVPRIRRHYDAVAIDGLKSFDRRSGIVR